MLHNYLVYSVVLFRKAAKESRIGKESPDGNIHTYHTAHELRVRRNLCSVFYASWRTWAHRTSHTTHKRCLRTRNSCLVVRMYVDASDVFFRSCFPSSPFLIVLWSFYSLWSEVNIRSSLFARPSSRSPSFFVCSHLCCCCWLFSYHTFENKKHLPHMWEKNPRFPFFSF